MVVVLQAANQGQQSSLSEFSVAPQANRSSDRVLGLLG
jgi:hypothetical protein